MVGIYFPLYDALTAELEASSTWVAPYAPLLAGSAARTVAVLCTSPLELIRTRMQAGLGFCSPTHWTVNWNTNKVGVSVQELPLALSGNSIWVVVLFV
jgi:hypothetical protein